MENTALYELLLNLPSLKIEGINVEKKHIDIDCKMKINCSFFRG